MSDSFLRLIPTNHDWQPDADHEQKALEALRLLTPEADEVLAKRYDSPAFVDPGVNLVQIGCPVCRTEISPNWFGSQLGTSTEVSIRTPCCDTPLDLNDLNYDWPAGFARFVLSAMNPNRGWLNGRERELIDSALGHRVREIWAHY